MAATRKLQGEIDRVMKKVQEGVDVFDGIWNKVYDTDNANQKEKFEADLKKEIKKLQRYRDQIKSWIQSSEIKDKKALIEARKLIEKEMERFKVCEKETKTKAFSKEGLGQQPKRDPRERAKNESKDWLNNMVGELESQIDTFESEMEGLQVKKGKQRPPRLIHLEESIVRHKAHITKLEMVLRLLENDEFSSEQVNDVKDMVEDYVERNQDDFDDFEDVESIYESLPIEKLEALENLENIPSVSPSVVTKEKAALAGNLIAPINVSLKNLSTISSQTNSPSLSTPEDSSDSALPVVPQSLSQSDSVSDSVSSSPKSAPAGKHLTPSTSNLSASSAAIAVSKVATSASTKTFSRSNSAVQRAKEDETNGVDSVSKKSTPVNAEQESSTVSMHPSPPTPTLTQPETIPKPESPMQNRPILNPIPNPTPNSNPTPTPNPIPNQTNFPNLTSPSKTLTHSSSSKFSEQYIPSTMDGAQTYGLGTGTGSGMNLGLGNLGEPNPNSSNVISAQQRLFNSVGAQWRPGISTSSVFQNQSEALPTRPEIPPDQKQRYISRFQQVQQQGLSGGLMYGIGQNLPSSSSSTSSSSSSPSLSSQSSTNPAQTFMSNSANPSTQQSMLKAQMQKYQSQNQTQGQNQSQSQSQSVLSNFDQLNFQQQKPFVSKNLQNYTPINQINQNQNQNTNQNTNQENSNMHLDQKIQNSKMQNFPSILQRQNYTGLDASKSVIGPSSSSSSFSKKNSNTDDSKFVDQVFNSDQSGIDTSSSQFFQNQNPNLPQNPQLILRSPSFNQSQSQNQNQSQTLTASNPSSFPSLNQNQKSQSQMQNLILNPNANAPSQNLLSGQNQSQSPLPMQNAPGIIGRRIGGDLGAIGDNLTISTNVPPGATSTLDYNLNLALLESSYRNIPSLKDSEKLKSYIPKNPVLTPKTYPQTPNAIIDNPLLWEKLDTDVLFFAFYYQQGTYQQYLAARELKKQSWRYHKKYNTWFQRHEEPKITTDEYEQGTYVYFDFHIVHDDYQTGWCQRIKTEFTFEYCYLEDELIV